MPLANDDPTHGDRLVTKKKQPKQALYLRRTLEDERVHGHVADAAAALRKAYARASRRGGATVEDKKFYDQIRESAGSLRAAARAIGKPPQPEPKRRGRKLLILVVLAMVGVVVAKKRASRSVGPRDTSDRPAEPVEPGRPSMADAA
jgi:hypothetical protein